jgi:hypothetical protein
VKVAGVMELLRTQGVWEHALRLAYQVLFSQRRSYVLSFEQRFVLLN